MSPLENLKTRPIRVFPFGEFGISNLELEKRYRISTTQSVGYGKNICGQIANADPEWAHGGYLNMEELNLNRDKDGEEGAMGIFGRDGILKTSKRYETISLETSRYHFAGLPYILKVSGVSEIIYRMDVLRESKTYMEWNNMLYAAVYGEALNGGRYTSFGHL